MSKRRLRIALVTSGLAFRGDSLLTHSLGGSETAFLSMAKALAERGHDVKVWVNTDKIATYDGVSYFPLKTYEQTISTQQLDVLISSRWPEFLAVPNQAHFRFLWLHDTMTDKSRLMGTSWQTDEFWLLSKFHIDNYCGVEDSVPGPDNPFCPEIRPYTWQTRNGVDLDLVKANLRPKVPGKLIYTSRPERGLHILLQAILPRMLKERPDLKLYYANYALTGIQLPKQVLEINAMCDAMAAQHPDKIIKLGHLTKDRLYQEISSAEMLLYPTGFPEISMITAMEAQACGTAFVSTNDFAIKETACKGRTAILLDGNAETQEYHEEFAAKALRLLNKPEILRKYQEEGPKWIEEKGYTWKAIAEDWENRIYWHIEQRTKEPLTGFVNRLNYDGDRAIAAMVQNEPIPELNPPTQEERMEDVNSGQARFRSSLEYMLGSGWVPDQSKFRFLDWCPTDAAFGMVVAKGMPTSHVVAYTPDEELAERLAGYSSQHDLNMRVIQGVSEVIGKFDVVYLGHVLDTAPEPWKVLEEAEKYVVPGGHIMATTRFGPERETVRVLPRRLWNFGIDEFRDFYPKSAAAAFIHFKRPLSGFYIWEGVPSQETERTFNLQTYLERRQGVLRPYKSLGVGMIVKNEEDNITKCLKAIRPFVDNIVMVDTGSTDKTKELAAPYVDTIIDHEFQDFGTARNISLDAVKEDWFFWIDADEVLLGGENIRKYLDTRVFLGLGTAQRHLMIDVPGTFDVPIRIFKNIPQIRFTGRVHEHAENIAVQNFDAGIAPSYRLDDADLAHYGYPSEKIRRQKASNRNMKLLIRDLKENPKRQLSWLLFMRDCLNIAKWYMTSQKGPIPNGGHLHSLLNTCVAIFFKKFSDRTNKYYKMVEPMYQEALKLLAINGLGFEGRRLPPIEVAATLGASVGGIQNEKIREAKPETRWFVDAEHVQKYFEQKIGTLTKVMKEQIDTPEPPQWCPPVYTDLNAAISLLEKGCNLF